MNHDRKKTRPYLVVTRGDESSAAMTTSSETFERALLAFCRASRCRGSTATMVVGGMQFLTTERYAAAR